MTVPTTIARAAVRQLHTTNAGAARQYLVQSKVGQWANHTNKSMASGNQNVLNGFDWYVAQDATDGRPVNRLDELRVVNLGGIDVMAQLDVVLNDGPDLATRIVLWDGPDFKTADAPVMACAFALALQSCYPGRTYTTVGIWQARRQKLIEVPHAAAIAQAGAAAAVLASM